MRDLSAVLPLPSNFEVVAASADGCRFVCDVAPNVSVTYRVDKPFAEVRREVTVLAAQHGLSLDFEQCTGPTRRPDGSLYPPCIRARTTSTRWRLDVSIVGAASDDASGSEVALYLRPGPTS